MDIKINKNFEKEYKDDAWRGFSMKEIGALICAAIVAGVAMYFVNRYTGPELATCVYIAVPVVAPIIACGFWTNQEMGPVKWFKEVIWWKKTSHLIYEAEERTEQDIRIFTMDSQRRAAIGRKEWNRRKALHKKRIKGGK